MLDKTRWLIVACALATGGVMQAAEEPKPAAPAVGLAEGDAVPAFESSDEQSQPWKSVDRVGKKVVVLYFYHGDFTGGCVKQAEAYREGLMNIEKLGVELVGVSGDEVATHKLFKETYGLKHALLADPKGELPKLIGVPATAGSRVTPTGTDRKPLLDADGKRMFLQRATTLARWTVVIGRNGKIASIRKIVNPITDSAEVLKIVEALPK